MGADVVQDSGQGAQTSESYKEEGAQVSGCPVVGEVKKVGKSRNFWQKVGGWTP